MDNIIETIDTIIENQIEEINKYYDSILNFNEIADRINEIRKERKLSQETFGKLLFISQDTISMIERGKRVPTLRLLVDICKKFSINWQWLILGKGEKYIDVLEELEITKEIKDITNDLYSLDEEDRETIKLLIKSIKSKIKKES
ncbi:helix-turn-helix transcriptional regulator [Clostridium perfringens]|nr:helix-turn-helix transcriptional regulator [Clostridium perfringens]